MRLLAPLLLAAVLVHAQESATVPDSLRPMSASAPILDAVRPRTDSVASAPGSDTAARPAASPAVPVRTVTVFAPFPAAETPRKAPVRTIAIGVDTTGGGRAGRSTWTAVGLTLLLPGSGHRYLGHRRTAAAWMGFDLVAWSTLFVAWQSQSLHLQDAAEIANRHAGASLGDDPDPALLETMRDWRSRRPVSGRRDSYDESLLLQGLSPDSRYPEDAAHDWDWGSAEDPENNRHIAEFEDALRGWRTSRIVATYAAGALLLSRVVAVADIIRIQKGSAARAGIHASVVPGPDGGAALVSWRF